MSRGRRSVRLHRELSGSAWERARQKVLVRGAVCWRCGRPLDFDAPPRSRWAPSVDHLVPLAELANLDRATRRRMALNPSNLRPAHVRCNSQRGAGREPPKMASRAW